MFGIRSSTGFSLTEVLLAVATLTIGMVFVGGTFFLGLHYATVSTEQTIGEVVAMEALNKIRLYGVDWGHRELGLTSDAPVVDYKVVSSIPDEEFVYTDGQYRWDALVQRIPGSMRALGVTVLVSRWTGPGMPTLRDFAIEVEEGRFISGMSNSDSFMLSHRNYIVSSSDHNRVYRVIRSKNSDTKGVRWELVPDPNIAEGDTSLSKVWTIPPNFGGRSPIIAAYKADLLF